MTWTTKAEVASIRELGLHRRCGRTAAPLTVAAVPLQERLTLLRQYQTAMQRRVDWGAIDPAAVRAAVARLITELEAGASAKGYKAGERRENYMTWTTKAELAFIRELGTHRQRCREETPVSVGVVPPQERLMLLGQYQAAMQRRAHWGAIDPAIVGADVARRIAALAQHLGHSEAA
jgi:hypothetical protein